MGKTGEARIPTSEFKDRVTKLQAEMSEKNIDVVFLYANDYFSENLRYLTDYWPHIEQAGAIIPKRGTVLILAAPEGEPYANEMIRLGQVRNVTEFMIPNEDYPMAKYWSFERLFKEASNGGNIKRLGIIGMDIIPLPVYQQVISSVGKDVEIVDCDSIIREMRMVKSPNEISMIKKSYEIAGKAIKKVLPMIKPGISEIDIAKEIEYVIRSNGCEWFAYRAPIMSGKRVNTVLGCATNKKLKSGEIFILAAGAKYEGYCSAYGRTLVIGGKPTKEQKRFIEIGLKAEELAMERLGPNKPAKDVDIAGREYLKKQGLNMYHLYSIGHGLGLTECNEGPHCKKDTDYILKPGNVVSLDVGLFGHPKHYGLRCEDGYVITKDGYERLTVGPKSAI